MNKPSKKKKTYLILSNLQAYLAKYNREVDLPLQYDDLLRYHVSTTLYDQKGEDTLWETCHYEGSLQDEIYTALTQVYSLLKTDGDTAVLEHLTVARIDFCQFGNSKPFRIRIINRLNDNYDHFYVKRADASRVYGLELEDLLSPNSVTYLVKDKTLIESHIAGIPGDDFIRDHLEVPNFDQIRIAKEFIKFNERCFVRLLGDMRSYNYVVDITPDIEGFQYRMRAIDFDQQSYEGRKNFYLPQYFKENNPVIFLGFQHMKSETVRQYQLEERSMIAARIKTSQRKVKELIDVMLEDEISTPEKIKKLSGELARHHQNKVFLKCHSMGEVVLCNLRLLLSKDFKGSIQL